MRQPARKVRARFYVSQCTRLENWRDCCAACKSRQKVLGSRASQVHRRHRQDPDRVGHVLRNHAGAFSTFSTSSRQTIFVRAPPHSTALLAFEHASAVARARRSHVRWDRFQQCSWRVCAREQQMSAAVVASVVVVCAQRAARPGKCALSSQSACARCAFVASLRPRRGESSACKVGCTPSGWPETGILGLFGAEAIMCAAPPPQTLGRRRWSGSLRRGCPP